MLTWVKAARLHRSFGTILFVVVAFALFIFPIGCFLILAFSPRLLGQGTEWWTWTNFTALLQGHAVQSFLNTVIVGVCSSIVAVVIGTSITWVLHRRQLPLRRLWIAGIWVVFLTPTYLSALGWQVLVSPGQLSDQLFGGTSPVLQHAILGPLGVIWVLAARGVPFAYLAVSGPLQGLGREWEDASRVHGASRIAALKIQLALLAPALWSAFALVFAESISDFGVASTLAAGSNFPILTYTIFAATQGIPVNFGLASAASWLLLVLLIGSVLLQRQATHGRSYVVISHRSRFKSITKGGHASTWGTTLAIILFFAMSLGVPGVGLLVSSMIPPNAMQTSLAQLTLQNYQAVFSESQIHAPLYLSILLAGISSVIALIVGGLSARVTGGSKRGFGGAPDLIMLAAVGIPSIVVGTGFVFAYDLPIFTHLGIQIYGTYVVLAIGYVTGFAPIVARLVSGSFVQTSESMLQAARVSGDHVLGAWCRTILPLVAPALMRAWMFAFSGIMFELPLSEVLHPPGTEPLSVAITMQMRYAFSQATALTAVAIVITLGIVGVAFLVFSVVTPKAWHAPYRQRLVKPAMSDHLSAEGEAPYEPGPAL